MKAVLEFNLPEEAAEHRLALDGLKWSCVCSELDNWLRALGKYEDKETVSVEEVRRRLREEIAEQGLVLE